MADDDIERDRGRLPAIFVPHGGGPWPIVDLGMDEPHRLDALAAYLRGLYDSLPEPPRAVLCVSAHWEAPVATVMSHPRPPMLYDYYGFPRAAYEFVWPAPGAPALAESVRAQLEEAGFPTASDPERGFDHGTFVPLMLADPGAKVPTLQLSLVEGLDPERHLAMGRALAPLRDEGVLIIGSGMSYHNMQRFQAAFRDRTARRSMGEESERFDAWLAHTVGLAPEQRDERLAAWTQAPAARAAHPREEHLLPLMVVAGSAQDGRGTVSFSGQLLGACVSAVTFS